MTAPSTLFSNLPSRPQLAASQEAFALWSQVYDLQANALLSLEERFLSELLPPANGLDIVDIGCGTGRWLKRLALSSPASLSGVDSSPAMVERARRKLGTSATVLVGDAESLPLRNSSADLLLASFVVSYVQDLPLLVSEIRHILRPGGQVFLSDLHPQTVAACRWKRSFKSAGTEVELATYARSLPEVVACFEAEGFASEALLEPAFGAAERNILLAAGKIEAFHAAAGRPAIYILQLRPPERRSKSRAATTTAQSQIELSGGRVAIGPNEAAQTSITIDDGLIATLGCSRYFHRRVGTQSATTVDMSGYLFLPGLTNSHDHLDFGLFPNLGRGPYANFEQWAKDIHRSDKKVIDRQRSVPKDVRLWWGAIRNLLCGATTVCHHNPIWPELLDDNFPVRVVTEFGWAHSVPLDPQLSARFAATPKHHPFVLHLGEGQGPKSATEIFELDRMQALDDRTVLVHGLALDAEGISLLNRRGAALVWCPTSNHFLFGRTHSRQVLSTVNALLLGSDSPLTSAGDLLDEVRYAYREALFSPEELYRMVVTRPPAVFRLTEGRGAIRPRAAADLIAVRDRGMTPSETLVALSSADVELVVIRGKVQLASQQILARLPESLSAGLSPLEVDGRIRWIRAPIGRLCGVVKRALDCDITLGKRKVRHVCPAWV